MEDLPPKTVRTELVRLDDSLKKIERTQIAGIQRAPGSLPVLEAFQQFLEQERRIARRRLLVVTLLAVVLILGALVGAGLYIRHALDRADAETAVLAERAEELATSIATLHAGQSASDTQISRTKQVLTAQQRRLQAYEQTLAQAEQDVETRLGGTRQEIEQLQANIERLLTSQDDLQNKLEGLQAPPPPSRIRNDVAGTQFPGIGPARKRLEPDQVPEAPTPAPFSVVTIQPEGRESRIRWMLPTAAE